VLQRPMRAASERDCAAPAGAASGEVPGLLGADAGRWEEVMAGASPRADRTAMRAAGVCGLGNPHP
jgi:hypothetical protein